MADAAEQIAQVGVRGERQKDLIRAVLKTRVLFGGTVYKGAVLYLGSKRDEGP